MEKGAGAINQPEADPVSRGGSGLHELYLSEAQHLVIVFRVNDSDRLRRCWHVVVPVPIRSARVAR